MDRLESLRFVFGLPLFPDTLVNFLPNLVDSFTVSVLVGSLIGPKVGLGRLAGIVWLAALLIPLAYTLSASTRETTGLCEIGTFPWESYWALFHTETRANLFLMLPAGAAALLFTPGPRRLAALASALALPTLIEMAQMIATPLGRACQLSDIFNNCLGVLIGFWMVSGALVVGESLRPDKPQKTEALM